MAFVADWALAHNGEIDVNLSATVNLTSPSVVAFQVLALRLSVV